MIWFRINTLEILMEFGVLLTFFKWGSRAVNESEARPVD